MKDVIVKSELKNIKRISIIIFIIGLVISGIVFLVMANNWKNHRTSEACSQKTQYDPRYLNQSKVMFFYYDEDGCNKMKNVPLGEFLKSENQNSYYYGLAGCIAFFTIITVVFYIKNNKQEIIIKKDCVEGTKPFNKKFSLPIKNITSCETSAFSGITIVTASEKIKFKHIKNNEDIQKKLSELLLIGK